MRRKVIAGNWKMNMTPSQAVKLVTELKPNVNNPDVDVVFCVPSIDIVPVVEAVKGSIYILGQRMYIIRRKEHLPVNYRQRCLLMRV